MEVMVNDLEYSSVEVFAQYLKDEERTTYTVEELRALNIRTQQAQHQIKHYLCEAGFQLSERKSTPRVRGFRTSSNDRWYGPGSDQTHGGGGF